MTAPIAPPRLELIDRLIVADREVDRLADRFRGLTRRLDEARHHRALHADLAPPGDADLRRLVGEYVEVQGQLHAARREALALVRVG